MTGTHEMNRGTIGSRNRLEATGAVSPLARTSDRGIHRNEDKGFDWRVEVLLAVATFGAVLIWIGVVHGSELGETAESMPAVPPVQAGSDFADTRKHYDVSNLLIAVLIVGLGGFAAWLLIGIAKTINYLWIIGERIDELSKRVGRLELHEDERLRSESRFGNMGVEDSCDSNHRLSIIEATPNTGGSSVPASSTPSAHKARREKGLHGCSSSRTEKQGQKRRASKCKGSGVGTKPGKIASPGPRRKGRRAPKTSSQQKHNCRPMNGARRRRRA